jgi:DNA-binding response OmpR family regulator
MTMRVLLLEDDPVVASFVAAALAPWPLQVEHVADLAAARHAAAAGDRLWLFDARLPDGDAATLLPQLRARGLAVPAIALTADDEPATCTRLLAAGFARVLGKPIAAVALRAALRPWLDVVAAPDWDDRAALATLGDVDAVRTLRRLFLDELPAQHRQVLAACQAGDATAVRERLHRLQAGCGFVGAAALLQAVRALAAAPADAAALADFDALAAALLAPR